MACQTRKYTIVDICKMLVAVPANSQTMNITFTVSQTFYSLEFDWGLLFRYSTSYIVK